MDGITFPFSDTIAGYVTQFDRERNAFTVKTSDGREFRIVKKFWRPEELAARVRPLGFELDLRLTGNGNFLYGFGS